MTIKAALLDERGVYLRMDELQDEAQLTAMHVPTITECDLAPGKYRWIPDERKAHGKALNPFGGAFWSLDWLKRIGLDKAPLEGLAQLVEKRKG